MLTCVPFTRRTLRSLPERKWSHDIAQDFFIEHEEDTAETLKTDTQKTNVPVD